MPLADIEKSFMGHLLHPQENDDKFLAELLPLNTISTEKQLFIYRSNINGAHEKVLSQVYPACLNILGEDYFNQLCRSYRFAYPSTDSDLNHYGEQFSSFIKEQFELHDEMAGLEYLAELAWLEWQWHTSYYSKNDEVFSFEELTLVDAEEQGRVLFVLSNSFSLFATEYPLLDIWKANKNIIEDGQEFEMPEMEKYFCITRVDYVPVIELLTKEEYLLLKAMAAGLTLEQLINVNKSGNFQELLMHFIQKKWIAQFLLAPCEQD